MRHGDIQEDDIGMKRFHFLQGLPTIFSLTSHFHVRLAVQQLSEAFPDNSMIVCNQDFDFIHFILST
jgi:hypothetical protein